MNIDDPKLTAYALGELDPAEQAEVEQFLRDDANALEELNRTRAFTARLRDELRVEVAPSLTAEQRFELFGSNAETSGKPSMAALPAKVRRQIQWLPLASAAAVIIAFTIGLSFPTMTTTRENARKVASREGIVHAPSEGEPQLLVRERDDLAEVRAQSAVSSPAKDAVDESLRSVDKLDLESVAALAMANPADQSDATPDAPLAASPNAVPALTLAMHPPPPPAVPSQQPADAISRIERAVTLQLAEGEVAAIGDTVVAQKGAPRPQAALAAATPAPRLAGPASPLLAESVRLQTDSISVESLAVSEPSSPSQNQLATKTELSRKRGVQRMRVRVMSTRPDAPAAPAKSLALLSATPSPELGRERRLFKYKEHEDLAQELARLQPNTEAYETITDNAFLKVSDAPLSTFSIDVDTASYANVRRFLNSNMLPPKGAVRIEELINYFRYDYPRPDGDTPFSATMEVSGCPWTPEHRLVRIGLQGREMPRDQRPPSNLVFLIDVSGSMQPENKLPLLKQSMQLLVDQLTPKDQVSIVVYAGASGCVLEPTRDKIAIRAALDRLEAGGSTNGGAGIQLAYDIAEKAYIKDGTNRVILATDGDFNVGVTNQSELVDLIQRKAKGGVFLSVLGYGMDNLKDSTLEKLADKGNGNYAYIDTLNEGRRVLVEQMGATLITIAKDVKIQVEFNPAQASAYRLIGYENRIMAKEDFNNDTKDAGEIGAGHSVTALYEVVPAGKELPSARGSEPLKYQPAASSTKTEVVSRFVDATPRTSKVSSELLTLKLRFKAPDSNQSALREFPLTDSGTNWEKSSRDFRWAAAVASFGMLLRDSSHRGKAGWDATLELALEGKGDDASGYRTEFVGLIEKAKTLSR